MKLYLNNVAMTFPESYTLEQVIGKHQIHSVKQIWVNGQKVEKSECAGYTLKDGDHIRLWRLPQYFKEGTKGM